MSLLLPVLRRPFVVLANTEALAFALALYISATVIGEPILISLISAVLYAAAIGVAQFAMGLYSRRQRERFYGVLLRGIAGVTAGSLVVALVAFFLPFSGISPKVLGLAWVLSIAFMSLTRIAFERLIDENYFKRKILVLGSGKQAASIARLRRRVDRRSFHIVGFVPYPGELNSGELTPLVNPGQDLLTYCREQAIEEIVVALDDKRRDFPLKALLEVRVSGIPCTELVKFLERETGTLRLDVVSPGWIIFSSGFNQSAWREASQRTFDFLMSAGLFMVAAIPMLFVVLGIKLTEGLKAPVFYKQVRVGLEGKHFEVLKFRSMRIDAERFGAVWATKNDPRITPIGRFMRKTRIDELPQIFNVLRGDMSFVGPRPERPQFVDDFEQKIPYYRERHAVKPGITGWAQLCYAYGATEEDAFYKLQYDLYYIKNCSLLFDFLILLQTIEVVLWGKGR